MVAPRVLLVRFSAIGDCVMAAWAATAIRERHPDAFLCWAVEGRCAPVIDRHRLVTQRVEFPRDRWKQARWSPRTWQEQIQKYARLRPLRFDMGFDLQGHSKTALCLRIAKPKRRIAAHGTDTVARLLNPVLPPPSQPMHTVEWNHAVINHLADFPLPAGPILPDVGAAPETNLVTIAVSAGSADKAYPLAQWEAIASSLMEQGYRVVFLGGRNDPHPSVGEDLVGKLRLKDTLKLVASSAVHLCADTGTGHMAAATGTPVVSVFGPTDPVRFRPYSPLATVLRQGNRPENISAATVLDAALAMLAGNSYAGGAIFD